MKPRIEVVAIDCLMVRLFDEIAESNMPWMLAAGARLRESFAGHLIDLVPSYTTLMVHYYLTALSPGQARELIAEALIDLSPNAQTAGQCHVLPVWYDLSVGPELSLLAERSGLAVVRLVSTCPSYIQNDGEGTQLFEPFGFRDGLSQPVLKSTADDSGTQQRRRERVGDLAEDSVVADGEFILGWPNAYGDPAYAPDDARRLSQTVEKAS